MPPPKGRTNNPNGRPKGSKNKVTTELKEWISELIDQNRELFLKDLIALEPKDRLVIIEKLMQYVIPKATESKISFDSLSDSQLNKIIDNITNSIEDDNDN